MQYVSISEMAKKWNISIRMVRRYCTEGRIPEAIRKDNVWMVPVNPELNPVVPTVGRQLLRTPDCAVCGANSRNFSRKFLSADKTLALSVHCCCIPI